MQNPNLHSIGKYKVIETIGSGECGTVYLVEHIDTKEKYAAKLDKKKSTSNEKNFFETEVKVFEKLQNPAILQYYGVGEIILNDHTYPAIIMEYMPNDTLESFLEKEMHGQAPPKCDITTKYIILLGISLGMKYLHSMNTLHRDLKPGNIMIDSNYYPRIFDFGFSKNVDVNFSQKVKQSTIGTPLYMAPEIMLDKPYNQKVDVYSFSLIAYEIFTGRKPYDDKITILQLMNKILTCQRPDTSIIENEYVKSFIEKCWSDDPEERPNFDEIARNLSDEQFYSSFGIDKERVKSYLNNFVKNYVVNKKDFGTFKTLILGTRGSDKHEVIYQWTCDSDKEIQICTASFTKIVETVGGCVTFNVFDTACDERYSSLSMMLFNEAKAAIFFININDKSGYESSVQLMKKKFEQCKNYADKELVFSIAFTHCDSEWMVPLEEIKIFALENDILLFMVSINRPETITSMFQSIADSLIKKFPHNNESIEFVDNHESTKNESNENVDHNDKKLKMKKKNDKDCNIY